MTPIPDLLHLVPMARVDLSLVREVLAFAFAGGGSDVTVHECCDPKRIAPSTWSPDCFEGDLFLNAFVAKQKSLEIGAQSYQLNEGHLHRVLRQPPSDPRDMRHRQEVLAELTQQPQLRHEFEQIYVLVTRIRTLLGESGLGYRLDLNRRRVEILEQARELFAKLAHGFAGANSGLVRLREFGIMVCASDGYRRLMQLLDFDDGMAALDARLRIGYDGQLRHFEIVSIQEQKTNPFYASRMGRFLRKFLLFVRGYRFSDSEVLSHFVDQVFSGIDEQMAKLFQLHADMEFYLAALGFRDRSRQHGLEVCLPEMAVPGGHRQAFSRELFGLFNPLLVDERHVPTPCTVRHARHSDPVVLTGPNSGGKTRLLQALSLAQLLGQAGFFVPAAAARMVWASAMFLSISENTGPEQREGRLGTELLRIRRVFESVRFGAFVVVDELCSGTNPGEGEEIFQMVLTLLRELSPQAFISTHFLQFAERLQADPSQRGLEFLQVELDATNSPTYQFVPGVATSSLALLTAARLGVTREELSALVERHKRALAVRDRPPSARPAAVPAPPRSRPNAAEVC